MLRLKSALCIIQALLIIVSSFAVYDSNFKFWVDRGAMKLTSVTDFGFDSINSASLEISSAEKAKCREWFNANILTDNSPAYDFKAGGKSLRKNTADWQISIGPESKKGEFFRNGKTSYIYLKHKKSSLTAMVEATIYEDYATCEWTVYIKNTGTEISDKITGLYACDCTMPAGLSDIYFSKGSDPAPDDFELMKSAVSPTKMVFNANGGRSRSFLPYFNICGTECGAVASVGWTGQWYTSVSQTLSGVRFKAKQEYFSATLEPGEEIRTPLVSFSFYEGNPLKGFNSFRKWEKDCVYPENITTLNGYVIANEFNTKTCDELIDEVNAIDDDIIEGTDYFWMDAGWYEYNEGWYDGVGNWTANKKRFPDGLKPLSDAMAEKGKRFLLWYEPERVREGTILCNEGKKHKDWLVRDGDNILWNLGSNEACDYLSKYISGSLAENGVSVYRQDFNFDPLKYWQKADKEFYGGREGICENHYVTNLYRYLDCLLDNTNDLIIDNCASGGKRLDTEMCRRSIPLWRSDYNCGNSDGTLKPDVLESTQANTYGLSFWLVYSGTNRHFHSVYASRSAILTNQSVYQPTDEYTAYSDISRYMTENYFPLNNGGTDAGKILAMQFGSADEGAALIYKRENASDNEFSLKLNGLDENAVYTITNYDKPGIQTKTTGKELMLTGITVKIPDAPKAVIIKYSIAQ